MKVEEPKQQEKRNFYEYPTPELKYFIGEFENVLDEFYSRQPVSRRSWEWFLLEYRAISGGKISSFTDLQTGKFYEFIKDYSIFSPKLSVYEELNQKKKALDILYSRRKFAKKKEEKQQDEMVDEIKISDIPF